MAENNEGTDQFGNWEGLENVNTPAVEAVALELDQHEAPQMIQSLADRFAAAAPAAAPSAEESAPSASESTDEPATGAGAGAGSRLLPTLELCFM